MQIPQTNRLLCYQNWILVLTLTAAIIIGYYQIQINKKLNEAIYSPLVEVNFSKERLTIFNRGKAKVYVLREKWPGEDTFQRIDSLADRHAIFPGSHIFIKDRWQQWLQTTIEDLKKRDTKWFYFKFSYEIEDHDGNIFVHEAVCGIRIEGTSRKIMTTNLGLTKQ